MNLNRKFIIGLLLLCLINMGISSSDVNCKLLTGTILSTLSTAPIIDGYLNDTVWENVIPTTFTLFGFQNQSKIVEIDVYSIYCISNLLYFGCEIAKDNSGTGELSFFFKVDANNELIATVLPFYIGNGHDVKYVNTNQNIFDSYTESGQAIFDTVSGGTNDTIGSGKYTNGSYCFEFAMPFDSGDTNGHDISITTSDEVEFFIYFYSDGVYLQFKETDYDWEYGLLEFEEQTTIFPINIGCLAIFGLSCIVFITRKK